VQPLEYNPMTGGNPISALIFARNDERTLGRALESLRVCDELVVVSRGSSDRSAAVAREYGARWVCGDDGAGGYAVPPWVRHDWVLWLRPEEVAAESLEAALLEFRAGRPADQCGFRVACRDETPAGWRRREPELRLVHRYRVAWRHGLPQPADPAALFPGEILRLL
jgi:glycosyltransferase involved in cell wall biosynthesis